MEENIYLLQTTLFVLNIFAELLSGRTKAISSAKRELRINCCLSKS